MLGTALLLAAIAELAPESMGEIIDLKDDLPPARLIDFSDVASFFVSRGADACDARRLARSWIGYHGALDILAEKSLTEGIEELRGCVARIGVVTICG